MRTSTVLLFLLNINVVFAQYIPGEVYYGTNQYIEYHAGDLPIIISAPHGGYLEPNSIPDRNCSGCVTSRDSYTEELAYLIKDAIKIVFGKDPHIIINKLARVKLDANREIVEAAAGNPEAEMAWYEFHDFIQASKDSCVSEYGTALYIDLHAHGHSIQRIELGYLLTSGELQNSDIHLDDFNFQDSSAIKHLSNEWNSDIPFSEILRGSACMGAFLHDHGYPSVPSDTDPSPAPMDPYFNGGYNTARHGSRDSTLVNGIQFELNYQGVRNSTTNRKLFAKAMACVLRSYIDKWYFDLDQWDPGNVVTSTADHGIGSLRSALLGASENDVITFDVALQGDTIQLERPLQVCSDITIKGPGAHLLAISGMDSVRILHTISHDSVNIEGLSLVNGRSPIGQDGGSILANGSIRLSNCIIANNFADDDGGAIALDNLTKTIVIDSCVIVNNSCNDDGGAIRLWNGHIIINASTIENNTSFSNGGGLWSKGTVDIFNSTFSYNHASNIGGAIRVFSPGLLNSSNSTYSHNIATYRGGAISNSGTIDLNHCTIVNNTSASIGGGIRNTEGGIISLENTLVAENSGSSQDDISSNLGLLTSLGYNIIADTTGSDWLINVGDQLGNTAAPIQTNLGTLSDHGGITETVALSSTSPAINMANPSSSLIIDQRGMSRIFCDSPDVGAFELHIDTIVWTGIVDTEWMNAANWDKYLVPTKCNVVVIPGITSVPTQPIITFPNAECKDLYLQSLSELQILNSANLKVREE